MRMRILEYMPTFIHETGEVCRSAIEKVFRRFSWVEKMQFELGSLVNLYVGFDGNSDTQNRARKLGMIRSKTLRCLKVYKFRVYRKYREQSFRLNNTKAFIEDLNSSGSLIHEELRAMNREYEIHLKIRALFKSLLEKPRAR